MAVASSKLRVIVITVFCISIHTGCLSSQSNFEEQVALFIFGDSLLDPGNNYINTTTDFQANHWPYGRSYFNPPSGRFTDGRLISDFIAEYAKLPLIPAYLEPTNNDFIHGANFASGGAGALTVSHAGFVVDLQTQLRFFCDLENNYKQKLGDSKSQQLISNAVYLFSCGGNDYQNFVDPYAYEQYVDMVIGNFTNVIKGIYEKGGRKFAFMTVPLIGCWLGIRLRQPGNACSKEIDDIIRLHNQAFAREIIKLERQLDVFRYSKFDIATSISNRMKNPSKYGFKEGETACCGSGPFRGIYSCGWMRGIQEYFIPTNRQFAELFWNGDPKLTEPYSLKTLFEGKPSTRSLLNDEL